MVLRLILLVYEYHYCIIISILYFFLILIPTYSPILGTAEGLNQIMAHLLHKRSLFTIILVPIWYLFLNKTGPYSL